MEGKETLLKLASGACATDTPQPVTAVIVGQAAREVACSTGPTDAILLDSNKIGDIACVEAILPVTNNDITTQNLQIGAFSRAGDYQMNKTLPTAADNALVVSDDYGAAGNNFMGGQRFSYLVEHTGVVISYFRVRGIDTATAQVNQRLTFLTWTFDTESNCRRSYISPACDTCQNNNNNTDNGVRTFARTLPLDGLHSVSYPLLAGQSVTIEIGIMGVDSAKNYVPCNSNANLY